MRVVKAVRDTQKDRDTAIVIHLDQGGKYHYYEDFFDKAIAHGVTDFDVIGLSYYPFGMEPIMTLKQPWIN